jgi:hypothetical protein
VQTLVALFAKKGGVTFPDPVRIEHPDRPKPEKKATKKGRLATPADVAQTLI